MVDIPAVQAPTLPSGASTEQSLRYMQEVMTFSTFVNALETAINTEGNVNKRAASSMAQTG
jgi:hypothetical protein